MSWKPDLGGKTMKKIRHTDKQTETVGSSGLCLLSWSSPIVHQFRTSVHNTHNTEGEVS